MKTINVLIVAITIFVGAQMLVPSKSEAGMTCKYDYWGNYVCTGTGQDSGYSSTTKTDYWGNDVTNYNSGSSSGSFSCKYDYWGNYVCN